MRRVILPLARNKGDNRKLRKTEIFIYLLLHENLVFMNSLGLAWNNKRKKKIAFLCRVV